MSKRILIAPLDWGLGHTTRCIPLIHSFLYAGCHVFIACPPVAKQLLSQEFNNLQFLPLDGYNIRYSASKRKFAFKILQQIPKIVLAVRREHRWLKKAVEEYKIDLVISDNRYGLYHKTIPCIFITHQLFIQTPFAWLSKVIQNINYRFINRFTKCWVPDYKEDINIAGDLSHPGKLPFVPVTYLGPLSRFSKESNDFTIKYKWLILLSGPEPQRTILEHSLLQILPFLNGNILLIRGLPADDKQINVPAHCTVSNHLPTKKIQDAFSQSEYIISRSGYTTIMEIISMQKKTVLIPTPGQTEQEYLANHLMKQKWCYSFQQHEDVLRHLEQAQIFRFQFPQFPRLPLQTFIDNALQNYTGK